MDDLDDSMIYYPIYRYICVYMYIYMYMYIESYIIAASGGGFSIATSIFPKISLRVMINHGRSIATFKGFHYHTNFPWNLRFVEALSFERDEDRMKRQEEAQPGRPFNVSSYM